MRSLLLVVRLGLLAIPVAAPVARAEETGAALEVRSLPAGTAIGILGQRVFYAGGTEIGRLVDVLVDPGGQPVAGVIDVGGFLGVGTRRVAVGWSLLHFTYRAVDAKPGEPKPGDSKVSDFKVGDLKTGDFKIGEIRIIEDLSLDEVTGAPEYRSAEGASMVIGRRAARP